MRKFLFIIACYMVCNGMFAQSLGKMTLGCNRSEISQSLPSGFNICKTNTNTQVKYTTSKGNEYVTFYLTNNIVNRIEMHKFVAFGSDANHIKSKLEELVMNLYEMWGEASYVGENFYWQFPASKGTFSYTVTTEQTDLDPLRLSGTSGLTTFYTCYADIKLEKKTNLFE
ncbi:MAG: hypothetical protein IKW05_05190 [Muribaculaceae bacterium]|nr:hypothetical protein [Muribaculaceae bacterium]